MMQTIEELKQLEQDELDLRAAGFTGDDEQLALLRQLITVQAALDYVTTGWYVNDHTTWEQTPRLAIWNKEHELEAWADEQPELADYLRAREASK